MEILWIPTLVAGSSRYISRFFFGCRNVEAFPKSFEYMALVTGVSPSVVLYAMAAGVGGAVRSTRAFYSFTKHHA